MRWKVIDLQNQEGQRNEEEKQKVQETSCGGIVGKLCLDFVDVDSHCRCAAYWDALMECFFGSKIWVLVAPRQAVVQISGTNQPSPPGDRSATRGSDFFVNLAGKCGNRVLRRLLFMVFHRSVRCILREHSFSVLEAIYESMDKINCQQSC